MAPTRADIADGLAAGEAVLRSCRFADLQRSLDERRAEAVTCCSGPAPRAVAEPVVVAPAAEPADCIPQAGHERLILWVCCLLERAEVNGEMRGHLSEQVGR